MIVVDVETGGLDPRNDALLSIGAVNFNDSEQTFYGECSPREDKNTPNPQALEVNGLTKCHSCSTPTISLLVSFLDWARKQDSDYTIAGENPSFDRDFLAENINYYFNHYRLTDYENPFSHRTVDLHSIAYAHMLTNGRFVPLDGKKNKLNANVIFVYTGIPAEPRPHNALVGAKYEAEAFHRLIYGHGLLKEFKDFPILPYKGRP